MQDLLSSQRPIHRPRAPVLLNAELLRFVVSRFTLLTIKNTNALHLPTSDQHSGGGSGVTVRRFLYGQNEGLALERVRVLHNVIGSTAV